MLNVKIFQAREKQMDMVCYVVGDLRTSKANKTLHGIGQQIVRSLVEKMEGMIDFYEEDKMFCVHIYLPE